MTGIKQLQEIPINALQSDIPIDLLYRVGTLESMRAAR